MPASYHGLLVLDKPGGMTSRDVVNHVQRWFPRGTRIGHTGTLDPLATGVLVLCIGQATRLTEYVQRMGKTYRAGLLLGSRSDTDDADGTVEPVLNAQPPDREKVDKALAGCLGEIEQIPPAYSAAKVAGRRAYALARKGEGVDLQPRRVRIDRIDVLNFVYPRLELEIHCGKGTYIRSLARDLGERLGCGALVQTLRRIQVGSFRDADALRLDQCPAEPGERLLPISAAVVELPRIVVDGRSVGRLRNGQSIPLPGEGESGAAAVFDEEGNLAAVVEVDPHKRLLRPAKVLTG